MLYEKKAAVLVFLWISLAAAPPLAHAEGISLDRIITNVEANEQLYANLEVILKTNYQLVAKKDFTDKLVTKQTKWRRAVVQGPMFYLKSSGNQNLLNSKSYDLGSTYGFDGEITRYVEASGPTTDPDGKHQAIVNVNNKRLNPCELFLPHTWILCQARPCTAPLSLWLRGGKALRTYPGNGRYKNWEQKTALEGEENVDGLPCVKLRCETWEIEPKPILNTRRYLWLAIERNYLPLKTTAYVMFENQTTPMEIISVKDFREIGPDVWLPFERELVVYDHIALRSDMNNLVVSHREKENVELAKLNPNYDVSFFRDIEIPDGAAVYEIKSDKIVNDYRQDEIRQDQGIRSGRRWWAWTVGISMLAMLLALGLGYAMWRRKHPR